MTEAGRTEHGQFRFTVKESADRVFVAAEPAGSELPALAALHGQMSFDLAPNTSYAQAQEIAEYLNNSIASIALTLAQDEPAVTIPIDWTSPSGPPIPVKGWRDRTPAKGWPDLEPAQQVSVLCTWPKFWRFLEGHLTSVKVQNQLTAAKIIRLLCGVASCFDLTRENERYRTLVADYRAWLASPEAWRSGD
jgi:hypothetical protein